MAFSSKAIITPTFQDKRFFFILLFFRYFIKKHILKDNWKSDKAALRHAIKTMRCCFFVAVHHEEV